MHPESTYQKGIETFAMVWKQRIAAMFYLEMTRRVARGNHLAAGDAFMRALACGLAGEKSIQEVLKMANAAGPLAATKLVAQPSLARLRN